jgi:hypothetical protein
MWRLALLLATLTKACASLLGNGFSADVHTPCGCSNVSAQMGMMQ